MAEGKKYNWANWDIKEQPKIELEDIPEEPKKERTTAEREEEVSNLRAKSLEILIGNCKIIDHKQFQIRQILKVLRSMVDLDLI